MLTLSLDFSKKRKENKKLNTFKKKKSIYAYNILISLHYVCVWLQIKKQASFTI